MRILYGVCGEGNGHATRSHVTIKHLKKKNDVKIVAGRSAYAYLKNYFEVEEISSFFTAYSDNGVQTFKTLFSNIFSLPAYFKSLVKCYQLVNSFNADIIITDWDPFSMCAGLLTGKPIISIDNSQCILRTKIDVPWKKFWSFIKAYIIIWALIPKANYYFITSFFNPVPTKRNTSVIPPLVRPEILRKKCSRQKFFLVYQTSKSNTKLIEILKTFEENFIVYCFGDERIEKNLVFKKMSAGEDFFAHLASCKGIITNGGFSLITEALCLGKPILSLPIKGQFEQELNAHYLEKLGFGMSSDCTNKEIITRFIEYSKDAKYSRSFSPAGKEFFVQLEEKIKQLVFK